MDDRHGRQTLLHLWGMAVEGDNSLLTWFGSLLFQLQGLAVEGGDRSLFYSEIYDMIKVLKINISSTFTSQEMYFEWSVYFNFWQAKAHWCHGCVT